MTMSYFNEMFTYFFTFTLAICTIKVTDCDPSNKESLESMNYIPEELLETRLIGGTPTDIENFPFLISIQKSSIPRCVGSLISDSFVITAAHCLIDLNRKSIFILDPINFILLSGRTVLSSGTRSGQERQAKQFIIHSRFERASLKYDVGIVKTIEPFILGPSSLPIKLYTMPPEIITFFQFCTLIGWDTGSHSFDDYEVPELNPNSMKLKMITMKVMNSAHCQAILNRLISVDTLCTYLNEQCPGQSGSPLICGESLFGVYTWTAGCTNSTFPAVFVRIAKVSIWVNDVISGQYIESLVKVSSQAIKLGSSSGFICFCNLVIVFLLVNN